MRTTDKITLDLLNQKRACSDGKAWFTEHFPEGGDYQIVLDKLAECDRPDWASWCLSTFGGSGEVREITGDLKSRHYFFAGSIRVSGLIQVDFRLQAGRGIEAGSGIKAGEGIEAGWGIKAGSGIEAGWGIEAGSGIEAGADFGIFAALRTRLSLWATYGRVIAKEEPKNLKTGVYVKPE